MKVEERFHAVDALRGIAAVSVLLFHLFRNSPMHAELAAAAPGPVATTLDYSRSGVAIFFVISGFVIAFTTRNIGSNLAEAGRFALRRQLRLDPPYWVMIAVVLVLGAAERLVANHAYMTYDVPQVATNLFYLQGFFHEPSVLFVAWTLCMEVQFYLVVVIVLVASARALSGSGDRARFAVQAGAFGVLGVVSLGATLVGWDPGPLFLGLWWMFCLGITVCWFTTGRISPRMMTAILAGTGLWCLAVDLWAPAPDPWQGQWAAWLTAVVLVLLSRLRLLTSAPPRWLLFLGTISYSLYLVHLPVIDVVVGAGYKTMEGSRTGAIALFLLGGIASILAAVCLNRLVERPAMAFAARFKRAPEVRAPAERPNPQAQPVTTGPKEAPQ